MSECIKCKAMQFLLETNQEASQLLTKLYLESLDMIKELESQMEDMIFDACDECTRKSLNKMGYSDADQAAFLERIRKTIERPKKLQEPTGDSADD